jgi:hypothetical protein
VVKEPSHAHSLSALWVPEKATMITGPMFPQGNWCCGTTVYVVAVEPGHKDIFLTSYLIRIVDTLRRKSSYKNTGSLKIALSL